MGTVVKRNTTFNILKAIGCISVVFIHVKFPGDFGDLVEYWSNFAVPCFLLITGYYSYQASIDTLHRRCLKVFKITILCGLSYFVFSFLVNAHSNTLEDYLARFAQGETWLRLLIINDFNCVNGGHLWYLPAVVYAYLVLCLLTRINKPRITYGIMWVLLVARLVMVFFYVEWGLNWHHLCNALFGSLPWMLLGNYFASKKASIQNIKPSILIVLNILGLVIVLLFWLLDPEHICRGNLGSYTCSVSLFMLGIANTDIKWGRFIDYLGAKLSLYVYVSHVMINGIMCNVIVRSVRKDNLWLQWTWPLMILVLTLAISVVLDRIFSLKKKKKS